MKLKGIGKKIGAKFDVSENRISRRAQAELPRQAQAATVHPLMQNVYM